MVTDHELLLAISDIIDKKILPLKNDIKTIKIDLLENKVLPRVSSMEEHYVSTANRYIESVDKTEAMGSDIDTMKKVLREHSRILHKYHKMSL